jgi:hydrogenase maturation protein HypF
LNEVALSGNMWQNQVMLDLVRKGLTRDGFTVYTHHELPANDGGLALGQAVVANCSSGIRELATSQGFAPVTKDDRHSGEKLAE